MDVLKLVEIDKAIKLLVENDISVNGDYRKATVWLPAEMFLSMFSEYEELKRDEAGKMFHLSAKKDGIEYHTWAFEFQIKEREAKN